MWGSGARGQRLGVRGCYVWGLRVEGPGGVEGVRVRVQGGQRGPERPRACTPTNFASHPKPKTLNSRPTSHRLTRISTGYPIEIPSEARCVDMLEGIEEEQGCRREGGSRSEAAPRKRAGKRDGERE